MQRRIVAVLMMLLCLLSACGGKETTSVQAPMDFRTELLSAGGCSFVANCTADYGETVFEFALSCLCRTDGTAELTVLAPESISGITARVEKDGGQLLYDSMAVDFGLVASDTFAPVEAPMKLAACWAGEYISSAGKDGDALCVEYLNGYGSKTMSVKTWFEHGSPTRAEIAYNGQVAVSMALTDFTFTAGGNNEATEEDVG